MENRRKNRGRRKRKERGLGRYQKGMSVGEKKGMGREGMERWKKSYLLGKVFRDCLVLWR